MLGRRITRLVAATAVLACVVAGSALVFVRYRHGFTCEQRQDRHVREMRAQADPLFASVTTNVDPGSTCSAGRDASWVVYDIPYQPRRELTQLFLAAGWTQRGGATLMTSPEGGFTTQYYTDFSAGKKRSEVMVHATGR